MGREVRRVPPGWEHPKDKSDSSYYKPLHDESYAAASKRWVEEFDLWRVGKHPSQRDYDFWEWETPPEKPMYREEEWTDDEATNYQLYETVSEGSPVSPSFATQEQLAAYLSENGDFWYQRRMAEDRSGFPNSDYDTWLKMIRMGSAPSMVVQDGRVMSGVEATT